MRPADLHQSVADSLQADVMRFMAIIAFCLIAILALVRSAAPAANADSVRDSASRASPSELRPDAAAAAEPAPEPVREAVAVPEPLQASPPEPQQQAGPGQEGLSLRFASEQDFLRLVNRGRIQVFAFNGDEVLSLDAGFSFRPVPAPDRIHELLPETIPELMAVALARRHGDGYRWGVAMPEAMARRIRRYVNEGATGELVIDRFGEVRHRGA